MKKGDKVFWDDPDDGIASGVYTITGFTGELIELRNEHGSYAHALEHELSQIKED